MRMFQRSFKQPCWQSKSNLVQGYQVIQKPINVVNIMKNVSKQAALKQTLDHIIAKLSKEKKPHNGVEKKSRILLVSETNNACLSLSSSDEENEEGGEPDLHQCGHCRQMFFNFTKYITHKLQKACWNSDEQPTPTNEDEEGETPPWPPSAAAGKDGNGIASPPGDESGVIEDTEDMETEVTVSAFFSLNM
eukprot:TCONS_00008012-protein